MAVLASDKACCMHTSHSSLGLLSVAESVLGAGWKRDGFYSLCLGWSSRNAGNRRLLTLSLSLKGVSTPDCLYVITRGSVSESHRAAVRQNPPEKMKSPVTLSTQQGHKPCLETLRQPTSLPGAEMIDLKE